MITLAVYKSAVLLGESRVNTKSDEEEFESVIDCCIKAALSLRNLEGA